MQDLLQKLRKMRSEKDDHGFTLIELLVVVVIIGILIAIAIPLYLNYENGAKNKSSASDLRAAISAVEQCYSDNSAYPANFTVASNASGAPCTGQKVTTSSGTTMNFYTSTLTGNPPSYTLIASQSGATIWYCYTSLAGGSVKTETGATVTAANVAACP